MRIKGAHFLSIDQLDSIADLDALFSLASQLEVIVQRKKVSRVLEGAILANVFFEPSTRTRMSFSTAFNLLGGAVSEIADLSMFSMSKGESIADMFQVMSAYVDVMVVRHPEQGQVAEIAHAVSVPVISAGDGVGEHPTQALLDMYTLMKEHSLSDVKQLRGLSICFAGDLKHARTVHSLSKLLSLIGDVRFVFVSADALRMPVERVKRLKQTGSTVIETEDFKGSIADVDVIYMTRVQEERFESRDLFLQYANQYVLDRALYDTVCQHQPIIMHPLPRNSRLATPELSYDLNNHPRLAIFRQAKNGIPIRMTLFCFVLGVEDRVFDTQCLKDVSWYHSS